MSESEKTKAREWAGDCAMNYILGCVRHYAAEHGQPPEMAIVYLVTQATYFLVDNTAKPDRVAELISMTAQFAAVGDEPSEEDGERYTALIMDLVKAREEYTGEMLKMARAEAKNGYKGGSA